MGIRKKKMIVLQFLIIMLLSIVIQFGFMLEAQAAPYTTITSNTLTVSMDNTGRYWLRLQPGNIQVFYADGSTSNTYVKINNTVVSFKNMTLKSFRKNGDVIEQTRTYGGVDVTLRLSIVNNGGYMKAELIFKNNNSSGRNIGGEFYWNTWYGMGSLFAFIENGWRNYHNGKQVTCFYKGTYHVVDASMVYAGMWGGSNPGWDYGRGYTYYVGQHVSAIDTVAAIWWDPVSVGAGQTRIVSTILGVGKLNIPPTLTLTSPAPNTRYFNGESFHLTGVVNDQDVDDIIELKYAIDNNGETTLMTFTSNGSPQPFDFNLTIPDDLGPGNHELQVWALDNKGGASTVARVPFVREDFNIPSAPTYSNVTTNSFTVNWDTNGNVPGTIYELFDVNENTTVHRGTGTSYDKSGLQPNTAYSFKTRAENKIGRQSNYSAVTTIYTLANKPLSKGYDNITDNSVRLLWNPNGNPPHTNYHYEVRRKSDNSLVAQGTVNGTSVTVTGLSGGHEQYRYFVRAISGNGTYTDFTELIIPSLNVYQKSNYVKTEWAIKMLDENILYQTSFEPGSEIPSLKMNGFNGNQSIVNSSEGTFIQLIDNITNKKGNHYSYPEIDSTNSRFGFLNRKYIPNGTNLSVEFKARSLSGTTNFIYVRTGDNHGDHGINIYDNIGRKLIYAETVDFNNPPNEISIKTSNGQSPVINNGALFRIVTSTKGDHNYGIIFYFWDAERGKLVKDTGSYRVVKRNLNKNNPVKEVFMANSDILVLENIALTLPTRNIINGNEWTTINLNGTLNSPNFNYEKDGLSFDFIWSTDGVLQIDDIKFGYATKAELYRDGTKVYEGFLSDYDDYAAIDKAVPNPVSSINVANTGNTINVTFDTPSDKGTTYNYQLKAVKHNGDVIGSEVKPVTITSGIKGYSYVIDSSPNTIPDDIVDTTIPSINHTINPNVKNYIHIKVIDNEGNVSDVFHQEIGIPVLTATPVHAEDYIHLEWDMKDDSKQYTYMVYKKAEGESEFQSIPVKDRVKVLEVYPYVSVLKGWTDAYGQGKITTNSVTIENFNQNPSQIWDYDVVVFGFSDANSGKDLTANSASVVEDFIQSGRGVLFGHDTLREYFPNFNKLAKYVNMTYSSNGWSEQPWNKNNNGKSTVTITRKGFLTNYPYKIGDVGTTLTIPYAHTLSQVTNGDIWLRFVDIDNPTAHMDNKENFYLTTWNNVAMIQTGHSIYSGNPPSNWATTDEQKLVVNTLFYLAQISDKTSLDDHTGQDITGPTKPTIIDARMINNGNTIHMEYTAAEDRGTKYYYYVEGTAPNTKVQSNIAEATIKTGLKGYSIVVDQNPNTVPDNTIETTELSYNINQKFYQKFYIHVAAVDNVGNISEVAHYECVDTIPPTITVTGNVTNWTNQDVVLTATASDNESGVRGIKLLNGEWIYSDTATFVVTVNGNYTFVAEDNFGNQTTVTVSVTKIDKTPPLNTSIIINNNDLYTNNRNVVLTISAEDNATGVSEMRFRTENSPWSAWVPYTTTFDYTMDAGFTHQGTNRVYVQFKDGVGNVGGDAFDSIIFDNIAPTGEIIYPKNTTNTRSITLTINAYDINPASADAISGLNSVRFRELQDGVVKQDWTSWEQHNFTRNWILSDGDGVKVIEMEIRDNAGNIGKVSKSIVLDTLFIKEVLFTDIVNPPLGNPELPTSEVVKVKKGYEFTFIVKTIGEPDYATYTFNGETGYMIKLADNLFTKTLKVDINDDSVDNELLPINITVARNDGTQKTTTLKVHVEGSAYDDFNINLTN